MTKMALKSYRIHCTSLHKLGGGGLPYDLWAILNLESVLISPHLKNMRMQIHYTSDWSYVKGLRFELFKEAPKHNQWYQTLCTRAFMKTKDDKTSSTACAELSLSWERKKCNLNDVGLVSEKFSEVYTGVAEPTTHDLMVLLNPLSLKVGRNDPHHITSQ